MFVLLFFNHRHKATGVKTKQSVLKTAATASHIGVHCVEEGDRIPPLQSYGQALKQKDCFLWCPG